MAQNKKQAVLVSPDGDREWTPESPAESTNLKARGWTVKAQAKAAAPKSDK